jgi:3-oxoacyl-[acyl-carrier-protein] synthase-1
VFGLERLVALAAPALAFAAQGQTARLPVICAMPPEERPGFDRRVVRGFLPALEEASGVLIDASRSRLIFKCRGGGAEAFALALERLRRGDDPMILVGGVDTFHDPDALEALDRGLRLHGPETENGFVPGEGSAFVLLTHRSRASALTRSAQVHSAAMENEPRPYGSREPTHGLAMTLALRKAGGVFGEKARAIDWVMSDVLGERHRVDEWSLARTRAFSVFAQEYAHEEPLAMTGDLGAASAAVMVATACVRYETGAAAGSALAIATHSDGSERGVVVVSEERA